MTGVEVYTFTHQIASPDSVRSGQNSEHLSKSGDQASVPSQDDFLWPQKTSNVNLIPSKPVSSFSSEQDSMPSTSSPVYRQT
jgi:hypothetical protein